MESEHEPAELVDLGAASIETQGPPDIRVELSAFTRPLGISNED